MTDLMQYAASLAEAKRLGVDVAQVMEEQDRRKAERDTQMRRRAFVDYLLYEKKRQQFRLPEHLALWITRVQQQPGTEERFDVFAAQEGGEYRGWASIWECYAIVLRQWADERDNLLDRR